MNFSIILLLKNFVFYIFGIRKNLIVKKKKLFK